MCLLLTQAAEKRELSKLEKRGSERLASYEMEATVTRGILAESTEDGVSALGPHRCVCAIPWLA